ncbi:ATP-binding protein [Streptomyces sp. NPDC101151]|uniref:ATP-binding protein n=1 Tax=Streptomyces sp. NPDC101151 TaxID=3366115 RepID=UPI003815B833
MLLTDRLDTEALCLPSAPATTDQTGILTLPSQEVHVATVRHFTDDLLGHWGIHQDDRDSAVLIVDELAANAVQHGHADMTLTLALDHNVLVISLTDWGTTVDHPHPHAGLASDEHGRGTGIIEFLALWTKTHHCSRGRQVRVGLRVTATGSRL